MILDATTKSIQILLGGSVTTNELPFVVSYADVNQSTFAISSISSSDGITTGTTPVTLVAAPGATTTRKISYLSVYNADTVSATVTIRYNNNGTFRQIVVESLASGSTLVYADTDGWEVTTSSAGTPGGSDTQVQFNDGGSFGGDSGLVYNKTTDTLTAGSLIVSTEATLPNSGLHVLDTNASHDLIIKPGSDLSADRILTVTTGDAARTVTLSGDTTLSDWFDQSVKSGTSPTFTATNFTSIPAANLTGTITSATQDLITRTGTITSGVWNAGAVTSSGAVTDSVGSMATIRAGGIGIASQAANDMFYASSATQLARVANGTTGQVWTATTSGAPGWAAASGGGTFTEQTSTDTGAINNFSLTASLTYLRCSGAAAVFSGFTVGGSAPAAGARVIIDNIGSGTVRVAHQSTSSTDVNRVVWPSANGQIVGAGGRMTLVYDDTTDRWRGSVLDPGAAISVPYAGLTFSGAGSLTWTVDSGDIGGFTYIQNGITIFYFINITNTSVSGTGDELRVTESSLLPGGFTASVSPVSPLRIGDAGTNALGGGLASSGTLVFVKIPAANYAAATNTTNVEGFVVAKVS